MDIVREPRIAADCRHLNGRGKLPILETAWCLGTPCVYHVADRCAIYATRPTECVGFVAGSEKCAALRREFGLPALVPVAPRDVVGEICAAYLADRDAE